jgi:hypothetical protein
VKISSGRYSSSDRKCLDVVQLEETSNKNVVAIRQRQNDLLCPRRWLNFCTMALARPIWQKPPHGNYKFIIMSKIVKSQAHRYGTDGIGHNSRRNETCAVPLREKRRIAARNCVGESLDKRLAMRIPNLRQKKIVMRDEQVVALHRRFGGQRRRGARPVCHLKSSTSINHWSR